MALHPGLGRLGTLAGLGLHEILMGFGRRGLEGSLLLAAFDFLVAQFVGHGRNLLVWDAQRLRIRLMTILSTRFKAACCALVAGAPGFGLFFTLGGVGGESSKALGMAEFPVGVYQATINRPPERE